MAGENFDDLYDEAGQVYDLDPRWIKAHAQVESDEDPYNVNPDSGAAGLMQLMPATADELGVKERFDARQNVMGGTKYLRQLLDRFGDPGVASAAYNAGPNAPRNWNPEYVRKVNDKYQALRQKPWQALQPAPQEELPAPTEPVETVPPPRTAPPISFDDLMEPEKAAAKPISFDDLMDPTASPTPPDFRFQNPDNPSETMEVPQEGSGQPFPATVTPPAPVAAPASGQSQTAAQANAFARSAAGATGQMIAGTANSLQLRGAELATDSLAVFDRLDAGGKLLPTDNELMRIAGARYLRSPPDVRARLRQEANAAVVAVTPVNLQTGMPTSTFTAPGDAEAGGEAGPPAVQDIGARSTVRLPGFTTEGPAEAAKRAPTGIPPTPGYQGSVEGSQTRPLGTEDLQGIPQPNQPAGFSNTGSEIGRKVTEFGQKNFPVAPEREHELGTRLAGLAGGMAPLILGGAAATAVGGPGAGAAVLLPAVAAQSYDATYQDALQHGMEPLKASQVAMANAAVQTPLMAGGVGRLFEGLPAPVKEGFLKTLVNLGRHGVEFSSISAASRFAQNYIAHETFNPDQPIMEGVGDSALEGLIGGMLIPAVGGMLRPRGKPPAPGETPGGDEGFRVYPDTAWPAPAGGHGAAPGEAPALPAPGAPPGEPPAPPAAGPTAPPEPKPGAPGAGGPPEAPPAPPAEPTPVTDQVKDIVQQGLPEFGPRGSQKKPVAVETPDDLPAAGAAAAEPTPAQAAAGNYKMGHITVDGLPGTIETPEGGVRRSKPGAAEPWQVTMPAAYGYIKGTTGADGDHVDAYFGPETHNAAQLPVWVIDQRDLATGDFDEHKAMIGFPSQETAQAAYEGAFSDGNGGVRIGSMTEMPWNAFRGWVESNHAKKPLQPAAFERPASAPEPAAPGPVGGGGGEAAPAHEAAVQPAAAEPGERPPVRAPETEPAAPPAPVDFSDLMPPIVEHTTGKGKVLRGVVRTDLTRDQAKAIDPYTFAKTNAEGQKGWFIREDKLPAAEAPKEAPAPSTEAAPSDVAPGTNFKSGLVPVGSPNVTVIVGAQDSAGNTWTGSGTVMVRAGLSKGVDDAVVGIARRRGANVQSPSASAIDRITGQAEKLTAPVRWSHSVAEPGGASIVLGTTPGGHIVSLNRGVYDTLQAVAGGRPLATEDVARGVKAKPETLNQRVVARGPDGEIVGVGMSRRDKVAWAREQMKGKPPVSPPAPTETAEKPPAEAAPVPPPETAGNRRKPPAEAAAPSRREISTNADGHALSEDENGVRSYVENGIRVTEPVQMTPRGPVVDPSRRGGEFSTVEEREQSRPAEESQKSAPEQPEQPQSRPAGEEPAPEGVSDGSDNKAFTKDAYEAALKELREAMNRLNAGFDPRSAYNGFVIAGFHIERGLRKFIPYAKAMLHDLGEAVRPHLKHFYKTVRDYHGFDNRGMDSDPVIDTALKQMEERPTSKTEENDRGLQGPVSEGDERTGPQAPAGTGEERPTGRAPGGEGEGSKGTPGPVAGAGPEAGERPGGTERPEDGRGADEGNPDRLPGEAGPGEVGAAGRPAEPRAPDAEVKGANFVIAPGALDEGRGPTVKARDNVAAIRLALALEADGRAATKAEQAILAKYVGWGGLSGAFPNPSTGKFTKGLEKVGADLKALLPPSEYDAAKASTQFAHYTAENVIRSMWDAVGQMGFKGGAVFEPGMGVGHFVGMMPPDMAAWSQYHGVELDPTTARIAKLLYPESGVQQADFTRHALPENAFDLVIGNPPFSDTVIKSDPKYAARGFMLHDYFFAKSLDAVRPGGLLAFVTSAGTMNKMDTSARHYLAERAQFLGGVRLPSTAFKQNAGTEVTTDVLFFQRHPEGRVPIDQADASWADTVVRTLPDANGTPTEGNVSRYFSEHPEMVLGQEGFFDKLYKGRYAVHEEPGADLSLAMQDALAKLPRDIMRPPPTPEETALRDFQSGQKKDGSFYMKGGQLMQYADGEGRPVGARGKGTTGGMSADDRERVQHLIPIRDALRGVFTHDLAENGPEGEKARRALNASYDTFVKKFGPINKLELRSRRPSPIEQERGRQAAREDARTAGQPFDPGTFDEQPLIDKGVSLKEIAAQRQEARQRPGFREGDFLPEDMPDIVTERRPNIAAFMDDPESYRLRSIEDYDDTNGQHEKREIFTESVLKKLPEPQINSANDGVLWSMNEFGRFDLDKIAAKMGKPREAIIAELGDSIFRVPGKGDTYQTRDEYLSGDVVSKLEEARAAASKEADIRPNIAALEAAVPMPIPPSKISMVLGMPWIPVQLQQDFIESLGLGRVPIQHAPALGQWFVPVERHRNPPGAKVADMASWGTDDYTPYQLLAYAMNRTAPKVYRTERSGGKTTTWFDAEATQAAQDKVDALKQAFKDWSVAEPERAEGMASIYNNALNRNVLRVYDGGYLTTPGVAAHWGWRPHQTRVVARIVQSGNTYMAHAVGAGKTSAMIGAGMEMKRLGLVNKPMYVVPNHMLGQFAKEFYEQYPLARIAVADERNFHTDRRRQFVANISQQNLDAVIITHSGFGKVPISQEFQDNLVHEAIQEIEEALSGLDAKDDRITVKRLENQKAKLQQKLSKRKEGADQTLTFEEAGVDFLFVDEAHLFRKLSFATKQSALKGISPEGSDMSWDLYTKARYLDSNRPGRSLVMASGTPVTNTMGELYTLSRFMQPQALRDRGISHFDSWAQTFGDTKTEDEENAAGGYEPVTRFSRFVNMPELYQMAGAAMDIVTPNQLEQYVTRPKLKGGERQFHLAPRTPQVEAYQADLAARMDAIKRRKGPPKKGDDILLSVINDGRHAAIDPRFVSDASPDAPSKLNEMVGNVLRIWKETKNHQFYDPGSGYTKPAFRGPATQMIFANLGVNPRGPMNFSGYAWIKQALIRGGVPANEIAFIGDFKSHLERQRLFNDVNEGKIRILVGSVQKMGTGVNAQRRLIAIHNQDPLWYPADDEQRNGRGIRQGNFNPEIEIHDYSTKGTYDAAMWRMMGRKARFIEQFFRGDPELREMEDLGEASFFEQASAMATLDERVMQLTEMKHDLDRALRRQGAFETAQYSLKQKIKSEESYAAYHDRMADRIEGWIPQRQPTRGDAFVMQVGPDRFTKRKDAATALGEHLNAVVEQADKTSNNNPIKVAEIGGFPITAQLSFNSKNEHSGTTYRLAAPGERLLQPQLRGSRHDPESLIRSAEDTLAGWDDEVAYARRSAEKSRQEAAEMRPLLDRRFEGGPEIDRLKREIDTLATAIKTTARPEAGAPKAPDDPTLAEGDTLKGINYSVMGEPHDVTGQKVGKAGKTADGKPMFVTDRGDVIVPSAQAARRALTPPPKFGRRVPMHSAVERAVGTLKQAKGTGEQMLAQIVRSPGVKAEEVKWLGLDDWLKGQKSVTRDQIADYVRANQLQVEEVMRGEPGLEWQETRGLQGTRVLTQGTRQAGPYRRANRAEILIFPDGEIHATNRHRLTMQFTDLDEAKRFAGDEVTASALPARYPEYKLPGGREGYRELLLTLPNDGGETAATKRMAELERTLSAPEGNLRPDAASLRAEYLRLNAERRASTAYRSTHWDEPNVLAHIRFTDRTAPDGKRVLLIEEGQSDWHQTGRRQGYFDPAKPWEVFDSRDGTVVARYATEQPAYEDAQRRGPPFDADHAKREGMVPEAPFKTSWPALVMRRMIAYAAEHGYDRVAWSPGDVHADRYSLRKQIEHVTYGVDGRMKGHLQATNKEGRMVMSKDITSDQDLADTIGKEAAEKLLTSPTRKLENAGTKWHTLSGLDLETGGEGMRGFYDRILPSETNKIVSRFGAKVGKGEISLANPAYDVDLSGPTVTDNGKPPQAPEPVHQVDITPELRHAAQTEGMPLFQRSPSEEATPHTAAVQTMLDAASDMLGGHVQIEAYDPHDRIFTFRFRDPATGAERTEQVFGYAVGRLIRMALEGDRTQWNLDHEVLHGLRKLGVISDAEWRTLAAEAERGGWKDEFGITARYPHLDPEGLIEEAVAEKFAQAGAAGPLPEGMLGRLVAKVRQFLARLRNLLARRGFQSAEDIFGRMRSGEVGAREPGSEGPELGPRTVEDSLRQADAYPDMTFGRREVAKAPERTITEAERRRFNRVRDSNITDAKFILPDGKLLGAGDEAHEYIAHGLGYGNRGEDSVADLMAKTGAIRINIAAALFGEGGDISIPAHPTDAQMATLAKYVNTRVKEGISPSVSVSYGDDFFEVRNGGDLRRAIESGPDAGPSFGRRGPSTRDEFLAAQAKRAARVRAITKPLKVPFRALMDTRAVHNLMDGHAMEVARARMDKISRQLLMIGNPMATGPDSMQVVAKEFANTLRAQAYMLGQIDKQITRSFNPEQRAAMGTALDEQSVFEQNLRDELRPIKEEAIEASRAAGKAVTTGGGTAYAANKARKKVIAEAAARAAAIETDRRKDFAGKGLERLPADQRALVMVLNEMGERSWEDLLDAGIVHGEAMPFWMPRMFVDAIDDKGNLQRVQGASAPGGPHGRVPEGGNIRTAGPMRRKHREAEGSEKAAKAKLGSGTTLVRDIRALLLGVQRSQRAVAGRKLIDAMKKLGDEAGIVTVSGEKSDATPFTIADHPAFYTWEPRYQRKPDGGVVVDDDGHPQTVKDEDGRTVMDRKPIWVARELEGPLQAIMNKPHGDIYRGLMSLKGIGVSLIMASPMTHNMVIYGKAFPLMPGKMLTLQLYRDGHLLRTGRTYTDAVRGRPGAGGGTEFMNKLIRVGGMVPINGGWMQDILGIAQEAGTPPGKGVVSKVAGAAVGAALGDNAKAATRNAIDQAGQFWHGTMLWDRIADLQAGIAKSIYDGMLAKGLNEKEALLVAAHIANRFAGVLPNESTSEMLRRTENIVMFSRQFTLGNLGVMKDLVSGLPSDIRAQLGPAADRLAQEAVKSAARRIAIGTFLKDLALFYGMNAVVQTGIQAVAQYMQDPDDDVGHKLGHIVRDILQGYARRWRALIARRMEHPLDWADPRNLLTMPEEMLPQAENEPGKQDRIFVGLDAQGRGIYVRNPFGKVGEEFKNWLTQPLTQLSAKLSPFVRPLKDITEAVGNHGIAGGYNTKVYDPSEGGMSNDLHAIAQMVGYYAAAQLPTAMLQGGYDYATGAPEPGISLSKSALPALTGITVSRGDPMGPQGAIQREVAKRREAAIQKAWPQAVKAVKSGDIMGAFNLLIAAGEDPSRAKSAVVGMVAPETKTAPSGFYGRTFEKNATDKDRERMEHVTH